VDGLGGTLSKQEKASAAEEPGVESLFSPAERWEMQKRAELWEKEPAELLDWIQGRVFYLIQIVEKLATGEKSLPGSTGQNIFYRALKEFHELATLVVKTSMSRTEKK
jgi:hypothetical protein